MLVGLAYGSFFSDITDKFDKIKQAMIEKFPDMKVKLENFEKYLKDVSNRGIENLGELKQSFEEIQEELKKMGNKAATDLHDKLASMFNPFGWI